MLRIFITRTVASFRTLRTTTHFPQTSFVIETRAYPLVNSYFRSNEINFSFANPDQGFGYTSVYNAYFGPNLNLARYDGNEGFLTIVSDSTLELNSAKRILSGLNAMPGGLSGCFPTTEAATAPSRCSRQQTKRTRPWFTL
jgi:hypothetical protein